MSRLALPELMRNVGLHGREPLEPLVVGVVGPMAHVVVLDARVRHGALLGALFLVQIERDADLIFTRCICACHAAIGSIDWCDCPVKAVALLRA